MSLMRSIRWLWTACLFNTRALAAAVRCGRVHVNGAAGQAKPGGCARSDVRGAIEHRVSTERDPRRYEASERARNS
jgi:hypothetical protein